jgi:hypothetical protein
VLLPRVMRPLPAASRLTRPGRSTHRHGSFFTRPWANGVLCRGVACRRNPRLGSVAQLRMAPDGECRASSAHRIAGEGLPAAVDGRLPGRQCVEGRAHR